MRTWHPTPQQRLRIRNAAFNDAIDAIIVAAIRKDARGYLA